MNVKSIQRGLKRRDELTLYADRQRTNDVGETTSADRLEPVHLTAATPRQGHEGTAGVGRIDVALDEASALQLGDQLTGRGLCPRQTPLQSRNRERPGRGDLLQGKRLRQSEIQPLEPDQPGLHVAEHTLTKASEGFPERSQLVLIHRSHYTSYIRYKCPPRPSRGRRP